MSLIMNKFKCTSADLYTYIKLLRGKYKRNIRYIVIQERFYREKNTIEGTEHSLCNNIDRRNNTCTRARACVRVCMLYSLYFNKISPNLNRFVVVLYSMKHFIFIN